ncbi:hypothetical protein EV363DRAFT_1198062 [Boletus edulis]|nr:hypothetical protein EV363DRAFT_1198062 [Boletus edulis]
MLSDGEALYSSETRLDELVGGTQLITFTRGESGIATSGPSLLITLGRWHSTPLAVAPSGGDSNLDLEESDSDLVRETNLGQEALLRYYSEYQREDLESAVRHFKRAHCSCAPTHRCYAVVLVNLAKAEFIGYQVDPTRANLEEAIKLYRHALDLRRLGHPDRSATLLQLAQILLFHYEKQGYVESIADEVTVLMTEFRDLPEDTHERRAADLVLDTLKRCRVVNSGSLPELDELVQTLRCNATVSSNDYFDKPQRLINLGRALWRSYEEHGEPSDIDSFLETNEQTLQLLPSRHPDRLPCLRALSAALWRLLETHEDLGYFKKLITLSQEALQLIPEGHPDRPYWISKSANYLAETSERSGDTASETHEAAVQYSRAILAWSLLTTHKL